jgi:hypothetical protein
LSLAFEDTLCTTSKLWQLREIPETLFQVLNKLRKYNLNLQFNFAQPRKLYTENESEVTNYIKKLLDK